MKSKKPAPHTPPAGIAELMKYEWFRNAFSDPLDNVKTLYDAWYEHFVRESGGTSWFENNDSIEFLLMCLDVMRRYKNTEKCYLQNMHWSLSPLLEKAGRKAEAVEHLEAVGKLFPHPEKCISDYESDDKDEHADGSIEAEVYTQIAALYRTLGNEPAALKAERRKAQYDFMAKNQFTPEAKAAIQARRAAKVESEAVHAY